MITTLTMNPSIDRTASLSGPLRRGGVNRLTGVTDIAGGKGVNVARVLSDAGSDTVALIPAPADDPFHDLLAATGVVIEHVEVGSPVRVNLTVTESDGTTTKLNSAGADMGDHARDAIRHTLVENTRPGDWVVLSGSLPPGCAPEFYADLVPALRRAGALVAVDTSEDPLKAVAAALPDAAPQLVKPNGEELGQMVGVDGARLEREADAGEFGPVVDTARELVSGGIGAVLVTLGGAGAVLVTGEGAWRAASPVIEVRSTVGAGDASLAGYLLGDLRGESPAGRLARAVRHGAAAAALPGTELPRALPDSHHPVTVTEI